MGAELNFHSVVLHPSPWEPEHLHGSGDGAQTGLGNGPLYELCPTKAVSKLGIVNYSSCYLQLREAGTF